VTRNDVNKLIEKISQEASKRYPYCDIDDLMQIGRMAFCRAERKWQGVGCLHRYASKIIIRDIHHAIKAARKLRQRYISIEETIVDQFVMPQNYSALNDLLANKCLNEHERLAIIEKLSGHTSTSIATQYRYLNSAEQKLTENGYIDV